MKTRRWLVRFCLSLAIAWATNSARADLRFDEPTATAGQVRAGQILVHHFKFVNAGPERLEISQVRTSCGCLKSTLAQAVFDPGARGDIPLEINTLSQASGPQTWRAVVAYRLGADQREATLTLTGEIVTEIVVQPAAVMLFADAIAARDITITDRRRRPLSVTHVASSAPALAAHLDSQQDEGGQRVCKVRFHLARDYPVGRREETIAIYTDDSTYPELRVPVTIIKRPYQRLAVTPPAVSILAEKGQPPPAQIVLIRDRQNQPVVIADVHADSPAVTCHWASGPGTMATLRIVIDRARVSGAQLQTVLHVHVRQPVDAELAVPVECSLP